MLYTYKDCRNTERWSKGHTSQGCIELDARNQRNESLKDLRLELCVIVFKCMREGALFFLLVKDVLLMLQD